MINAQNILEHSFEHGGGSFRAIDGEPVKFSRGYAVSLSGLERRIDLSREYAPDVTAMIQGYIQEHAATLFGSGKFLGTWIDGVTLYLDISELVFSKDEAMRLGASRNQLAVYDFANNQTVSIKLY